MLNIVDLTLRDTLCCVRIGRADLNCLYDVLNSKSILDVVVLYKLVVRQENQGYLSAFALPFGWWYSMLSRAREADEIRSDNDGGSAAKIGGTKKKTGFEVGSVPLHYNRKVGNTMNSTFRRKAHRASVCKQSANF